MKDGPSVISMVIRSVPEKFNSCTVTIVYDIAEQVTFLPDMCYRRNHDPLYAPIRVSNEDDPSSVGKTPRLVQ